MIALPDRAKSKLRDLELARMSAEDAARAIANRLNGLARDADQQMRDRLAAELTKHQHRFGQLHQLTNRINQWLMELRPNVALQLAPPVKIELKNTETLSAALGNLRSQVIAVRQHLQAVRTAPLPKDDQKHLAVAYVARLLQTARPKVAVVSDQLRVSFRGDMHSAEDVLALYAWADPKAVCTALDREIDDLPARPDAMPVAERVQRIAELEKALDEIERAEEALIERAAGDGIEVLHRPDASPAAVLGVVVVVAEKEKATAAA